MTLADILLLLLVPAGISIGVTPVAMALARVIGAIDHPNGRKVHSRPTPRLGGVAIAATFFFTAWVGQDFLNRWDHSHFHSPDSWPILTAGLLTILLLGVIDDIKGVRAGRKFFVQVAVATVVCFSGVRFEHLAFFGSVIDLGWFSFPISVLWIVGITNAMNLMDGLDGLATGVTIFASIAFASLAWIGGVSHATAMALILAGAALGFLRYNFNPARIFLGDSGSLFLGFALATLAIEASTTHEGVTSVFVPVVVLGLPIADTTISVIRRLLKPLLYAESRSARKPRAGVGGIFSPDRNHIHHQLLTNGFSHRWVVIILYGVSALLGVSAFVIYAAQTTIGSSLLVVVLIAMLVGVNQLRYNELAVHRNGILLRPVERFFSWPTLKRTRFQAAGDAVFVLLSYGLAFLLTEYTRDRGSESTGGIPLLAAVTAAQILCFWFAGLYREATRLMGIADAFRVTRAALLGSVALLAVSKFGFGDLPSLAFILVDFFVLHLLLIMTRFLYSTLDYLLNRNFDGKPKVVIYGADPVGLAVLKLLVAGREPSVRPVGFLDDDPAMEGRSIQGLPIFGGYRKLAGLRKNAGVDEVIIPRGTLQREVIERVKSLADSHDVKLREFAVELEVPK